MTPLWRWTVLSAVFALAGCLDTTDAAAPAQDPAEEVLTTPANPAEMLEQLKAEAPSAEPLPLEVQQRVDQVLLAAKTPRIERDPELPVQLYDCWGWAHAGKVLSAAQREGKSLDEAVVLARSTPVGQAASLVTDGKELAPGFSEFLARTVYQELDNVPAFVAGASLFQLCRAEKAAVEEPVLPGTVLGRVINEGQQIKAGVALLKAHRAANTVVGDDPQTLAELVPQYLSRRPRSWNLSRTISQGLLVTIKPLAAKACADVNSQAGLPLGQVTRHSGPFGCIDQPGEPDFNHLFFTL